MDFSDQLRSAIRDSKLTQYRIAEEAGVHRALLWRFMRGETGLTTTTLDALARVLRLRLDAQGPRASLLRKHGV